MWISQCAAERRISDRYLRENGGVGEPKLPGKFFGYVLVDLRVRNIDLRFPAKHSLLGRSGRAAFLVTLVAIMFPVRAEALSCLRPEQFYDDRHGERRDARSSIEAFVDRAGTPRACTRARAAVPR